MKKFWNFIRNNEGERILRLEGPIDEDNFWGDEVTPTEFRNDLEAEEGDVTVWINSPGGNVFAAAEIYTMLLEHKGKVTVKIDAIAASAASVIAMAGDRVQMSPVAMLMMHDPSTIACGNTKDMEKAIATLNEVKESIINAYAKKSGLSRNKIAKLMSDETWLNARKAVGLGFADEVLYTDDDEAPENPKEGEDDVVESPENMWQTYSTKAMGQRVLNWLMPIVTDAAEQAEAQPPTAPVKDKGDSTGEVNPVEPTEPVVEPTVGEASGEPKDHAAEPVAAEPKPAETAKSAEEPEPVAAEPEMPVIGLDGKTKDGAMPYVLLKRQLDLLK